MSNKISLFFFFFNYIVSFLIMKLISDKITREFSSNFFKKITIDRINIPIGRSNENMNWKTIDETEEQKGDDGSKGERERGQKVKGQTSNL